MAKKKVEEVVEETVVTEKPHVVFHKERWDNDSGTNQLVADKLPSLND